MLTRQLWGFFEAPRKFVMMTNCLLPQGAAFLPALLHVFDKDMIYHRFMVGIIFFQQIKDGGFCGQSISYLSLHESTD